MRREAENLIALFYESAASPSRWGHALTAFANAADALDAHIVALDKTTNEPLLVVGHRGPLRDILAEHSSGWAVRDPLITGTLSTPMVPGSLMLSQDYLTRAEPAHQAFYQDVLIPRGLRHQAAWILEASPAVHAVVALHRNGPAFNRASLQSWDGVIGHLQRAVRLGMRLGQLEAQATRLGHVAERARLPYLLVDAAGRLLRRSDAASNLLNGRSPLHLKAGLLSAANDEEHARLTSMIGAAARGLGGGTIRLTAENAEAMQVDISPAGSGVANPFTSYSANCALILLRPRLRRRSPTAASLRQRLQCTLAEAQVASALASGHSPRQIAAMREVSINTVRAQIRALFAGTNTQRIGELIARMAAI
jgi:DNA-binding CsgD family transcriptional regulator